MPRTRRRSHRSGRDPHLKGKIAAAALVAALLVVAIWLLVAGLSNGGDQGTS
jgi:hypothetical protein